MKDKTKSDHPKIWRYRLVTTKRHLSRDGGDVEFVDLTITHRGASRLLDRYLRFDLADCAELRTARGNRLLYTYALPFRAERQS